MSGKLKSAKPISVYPWVVTTLDQATHDFLANLPTPDFSLTEETKAKWAVQVNPSGTNSGEGTAFVVSGEVMIYLKAHRYSGA